MGDSLGNLPKQPSGSSPAEKIGRVFRRLLAEYGAPWGRDEDLLAQMRADWESILGGFIEGQLQDAVSRWMSTQDKWPKASNIRHMILDAQPRAIHAHKAEPWNKPAPDALDRMKRMTKIREKYKHSATPFGDTMADPEYQAILDEYTKATGRQPA